MKKYCFQYATDRGKIFEDTKLITLKRAKEYWKEYYPFAIEHIKQGIGVQMYIWKNMQTEDDFRETLIFIDNDFITDGQFIYPPKTEPIKIDL